MRAKHLSFNVPDSWNLFLAGDSQWGNIGTHEKGIDKFFDMVHSEYRGCSHNRVAWMGDTIDTIDIADKRFDFRESKMHLIRSQRDHALNRLSAIKNELIIFLNGNHEQRVINTYGDISDEMAAWLGCVYGTRCCVPQFIGPNDRLQFRTFLHHGFGKLLSNAKDWVQSQANLKAALKQRLQHLFSGAALMAMGHTHQLHVVSPDPSLQITTDDAGELQQVYRERDERTYIDQAAAIVPEQYRWYVNTGSFLRTYTEGVDGYAERAGLRPVEMGFAVACIRDGRLTKVYKEVV
jgi:hypothetical protein